MKPALLLTAAILASSAILPARAALFRPEIVSGAVLGGVAGAIIGHNDGRHGWEGAAYGSAAGAAIGGMVGHSRDGHHEHRARVHLSAHRHVGWASSSPRWRGGFYHRDHHRDWNRWHRYDPQAWHGRGWGYRRDRWAGPAWEFRSGWIGSRHGGYLHSYPYHREYPYHRDTSHAARGALLGGIAGAIIGHNDGRHGWEGAAYGLGAGYLLGSLADARSRRDDVMVRERAYVPVVQAPAASAPAQVTIINNYYSTPAATPMSAANGLFGR